MSRIPLVDESDPTLAPGVRALLEQAGASRGWLVNVFRALANRPAALEVMTRLLKTVYREDSTLERQHGELAYLAATTANNCFY